MSNLISMYVMWYATDHGRVSIDDLQTVYMFVHFIFYIHEYYDTVHKLINKFKKYNLL